MGNGAADGRNERQKRRCFGEKDVYFLDVWLTDGFHAHIFSCHDATAPRALRHGVAGVSIGFEKAPALFGARRCEPIFDTGPQNTIGTAIKTAGGDTLRCQVLKYSVGVYCIGGFVSRHNIS
jgi:hypothetical protein